MNVGLKLYGILMFFSAFAVGYSSQAFFGVRQAAPSETSTHPYLDKSINGTFSSDCFSPGEEALFELKLLYAERSVLREQKRESKDLRELNKEIRRFHKYVDSLLNEPDPNKSAPLNDLVYRKRCF